MKQDQDVREMVKSAYGTVARQQAGCCGGPASCCGGEGSPVPAGAAPFADLGLSCGNPVGFTAIRPGDVVLDLGSGAGRDVFQAAELTGPAGRVIGVDMTPDMIRLAEKNARMFQLATGLDNVEFRPGYIEQLPVGDGSVDVVISNCVINLSPDKPKVFREIHRALKPRGRMVVSDIVLERELPPEVRADETLYAGCIAGALLREDYLAAIRAAGFVSVEILSDLTYTAATSADDPITHGVGRELAAVAASITVRAEKDN